MTAIVHTFLLGAASVGALFLFIWAVHLILRNAAIVDVGWGLGFIVLSFEYIERGEGFNLRNTVCFLMVLAWSVRIILYLFKRFTTEKQEDKRYKRIRQNYGRMAWLKFLFLFETQAALEMIIGIPLIIISLNPNPGLSYIEILGAALFTVALIGETAADEQLFAFKNDAANKGKTCDAGLWRYSRHPNYFFEWLVWGGFFVFALGSPMGWVAVISPVLMYFLLMHVSGVPLAEAESLHSRGEEYRCYQQTTSMFVPWFKRKKG